MRSRPDQEPRKDPSQEGEGFDVTKRIEGPLERMLREKSEGFDALSLQIPETFDVGGFPAKWSERVYGTPIADSEKGFYPNYGVKMYPGIGNNGEAMYEVDGRFMTTQQYLDFLELEKLKKQNRGMPLDASSSLEPKEGSVERMLPEKAAINLEDVKTQQNNLDIWPRQQPSTKPSGDLLGWHLSGMSGMSPVIRDHWGDYAPRAELPDKSAFTSDPYEKKNIFLSNEPREEYLLRIDYPNENTSFEIREKGDKIFHILDDDERRMDGRVFDRGAVTANSNSANLMEFLDGIRSTRLGFSGVRSSAESGGNELGSSDRDLALEFIGRLHEYEADPNSPWGPFLRDIFAFGGDQSFLTVMRENVRLQGGVSQEMGIKQGDGEWLYRVGNEWVTGAEFLRRSSQQAKQGEFILDKEPIAKRIIDASLLDGSNVNKPYSSAYEAYISGESNEELKEDENPEPSTTS